MAKAAVHIDGFGAGKIKYSILTALPSASGPGWELAVDITTQSKATIAANLKSAAAATAMECDPAVNLTAADFDIYGG